MTRQSRQRGEGRAGCMFWLAVLVVTALIGFKMVPAKFASSQFYDFMDEQAKFAQQTSADQMKKTLQTLRTSGTTQGAWHEMLPFNDVFNGLLGWDQALAFIDHYTKSE